MAVDNSKIVITRAEWREVMVEIIERSPAPTPERIARLRAIVGADYVDVRPRAKVAA